MQLALSSDPTTQPVFVYGTLIKSGSSHHLLAGSRFIGTARTTASFELWDLGEYPAMVSGGRCSIAGELYEVRRELIRVLDDYEGHPELFRRFEIWLAEQCEPVTSYLYVSSLPSHARKISSGSWSNQEM